MIEVSNCCGARVLGSNGTTGRCSECFEGCGVEYMPEEVESIEDKELMYVKPNRGSMYDLVKMVLKQDKQSRSDDRRLIWTVYVSMGLVKDDMLDYEGFKECPTPETITRARRKVQELCPELVDEKAQKRRAKREDKKGYFVFNEKY